MNVTCNNCRTTLTIPDDKIPQGKKASFLCPKCRERVYILASMEEDPSREANDYDASQKGFDYIDENTATALLCMADSGKEKFVEKVLQHHGYYVIAAGDADTALTRLKYHLFDIVVVEEDGDGSGSTAAGVLPFLERLETVSRRKVIVILVTGRYRTMDRMNALHESVNLIINPKDLKDAEKIINRSIQENKQFYSVYNEALRKAGKG
ncbi:MAG: hypothetical protein V1793_09805 [Pseudomonadota bacterium]